MKKTDTILVPYQGAAKAMTDVMAGHIGLGFVAASIAVPNANAGKLRLLASTNKIAGVNTVILTEKYKDWKQHKGYLLIMPQNAPKEYVKFWTNMIVDFLSDPTVTTKLNNEYLY